MADFDRESRLHFDTPVALFPQRPGFCSALSASDLRLPSGAGHEMPPQRSSALPAVIQKERSCAVCNRWGNRLPGAGSFSGALPMKRLDVAPLPPAAAWAAHGGGRGKPMGPSEPGSGFAPNARLALTSLWVGGDLSPRERSLRSGPPSGTPLPASAPGTLRRAARVSSGQRPLGSTGSGSRS